MAGIVVLALSGKLEYLIPILGLILLINQKDKKIRKVGFEV